MEYLLTANWTVKAEWLHYDLGSVSYSNRSLNGVLYQLAEWLTRGLCESSEE
jgi:hypothetical protein